MFTEDLTPMFDPVYGFAVTATWNGTEIPVLFDREYFVDQPKFMGIEDRMLYTDIVSSKPAATCRTSDVSAVKQGDTITIDGTTYTVVVPMPDGTGITVLSLQL